MQRPAEKLASSIERVIKRHSHTVGQRNPYVVTTKRTMQRWLKLAKSIDARMRLDGSPKNRRKKPTPNRRTK